MRRTFLAVYLMVVLPTTALSQEVYEGPKTDKFETSEGILYVTPVVHGSVMFQFGGKVIHVDPWSRGDYSDKPKADLILITHHHRDHLDQGLIEKLRKPDTVIVGNGMAAEQLSGIQVLINGESSAYLGIAVEAVPAYNVVRERSAGVKYHPKDIGNGYILTFGDKRVYVAGDTENIPEMADLKDIYIAFLPCNLPYTMAPEELVECVKAVRPAILYPYHLGNTDKKNLQMLLSAVEGVAVRMP